MMDGILALCAGVTLLAVVGVLFRMTWNARRATRPHVTSTDVVPTLRAELTDRVEEQLAELDRLIAAADEEITRLEDALAVSRRETLPLTSTQQQQCFAMWEAGFTVEEIAERLVTVPHQVQTALDEWRRPQQRAA